MPIPDAAIEAATAAIRAARSGTTVRAGRVMGPTGAVGHGVIRLLRSDGVAMVAAPAQALVGHGPVYRSPRPDYAIAALFASVAVPTADDILAALLGGRLEG